MNQERNIKHKLWPVLIIAMVLVELLISNDFVYLLKDCDPVELDMNTATGADIVAENGKVIAHANNVEIEFILEEPVESYYIDLEFKGNADKYISGEIFIRDESRINKYEKLNAFGINPAGRGGTNRVTVPIKSSGKMTALSIRWRKGYDSLELSAVKINALKGIRFKWQRWLVLEALAAAVYSVYIFKLGKRTFSIRDTACLMLFLMVLAVNMSIPVFVRNYTNIQSVEDIPYPLEKESGYYDIDVRTFDAIYHGETYLKTPLSEEDIAALEALENPYDRSQRDDVVKYMWDYAFYGGHYYSYFGVAPVLTFYFPYYFLTRRLPCMAAASLFYTELAILFISLILLKVIEVFKARPSILTVALTELALPAMLLLYMLQGLSNMYYLVYTTAYAFLAVFVYLSILAYQERKRWRGILWYALAALSLVCAVASRPMTIVPVFIAMLPLYLHVLTEKDNRLCQKIVLVSAFAVPLLAGAAAIMWYNYIRFDSPFDFGATHQLTVSDIHYNKVNVSLSSIWSYIVQYWLCVLRPTEKFPFIAFESINAYGNGSYRWIPKIQFGVMSIPICMLLVLFPLCLKRKELYQKGMMLGAFISSVVILYVDYCVGGIFMRYLSDSLPMLVALSCVVAWHALRVFEKLKWTYGKGVIYALLLVSTFVGYMTIFYSERVYMLENFPNMYIWFQRFFGF